MNPETSAKAVVRARQEVAAALSILLDPASDSTSAEPHLVDAWRLLHQSVTGAAEAADDETLLAWLRTECGGLSGGAKKRAGEVCAQLIAGAAIPSANRIRSVSSRALLTHARDVGQALDHYEPAKLGPSAMRMIWLGRIAKTVVVVVLAVAFVVTIRGNQDLGTGSWHGSYYPTKDFGGQPTLRRDADVDFNWASKPPHERISADLFSVQWNTCLVLDEASEALFELRSNDGSRLLVDGEVVVDLWKSGSTRRRDGSINLAPGVHHLQIDYYEVRGHALVTLRASLQGEKPTSIPDSLLRYPGDNFDPDNPCGSVEE
ncbi:MAG: PA14 domain-containing protein [Myxococcota bacterium]